jgi:hypothetical protein
MKKVYEYMGIEPEDNCESISSIACSDIPNCKECTLKKNVFPEENGNLMVLAINSMREKGDWSKFIAFCYKRNTLGNDFMSWLFGNPAKFFELFESWREEVEKNEKAD